MGTLMLVILTSMVFGIVDSSKILVIPDNMGSHINIFTILGKALRDDGHEVWMLAYDKYDADIRKRGITPLTFPLKPEDDLITKIEEWTAESVDSDVDNSAEKWAENPQWVMALSRVCDSIMQSERLVTTIQEEKFDLLVLDGVELVLCHLMIPYRFDIPFVTVHGFQTASWVAGITGMPSIEPEVLSPVSNRMTFWQRLENLKTWLGRVDSFFYNLYDHHMNSYCPKNKPKIPLKKVAEMSEMYFMNYEIMCVDYPRVSAPNMQFLGATTASPANALPEELEKYIVDAEDGVIVMSLGTNKGAQHIWKLIGKKVFDAFARLPQRVIVQYGLENVYGNLPGNVRLLTWLPQNDLLGHKNVRLFITHGGNNGQNEAAYHGVPMLVIPILVDQMYNGKRIEAHSYGKYVKDKKAITSDELFQLMSEIINNKTYEQNIKKCSQIIRSMPTASETFVFWVNHILRFGGAHLRPPSLDMPLYQVLMLDIVAYYVIYYLLIIYFGLFVVYYAFKSLRKYWTSWKVKEE